MRIKSSDRHKRIKNYERKAVLLNVLVLFMRGKQQLSCSYSVNKILRDVLRNDYDLLLRLLSAYISVRNYVVKQTLNIKDFFKSIYNN